MHKYFEQVQAYIRVQKLAFAKQIKSSTNQVHQHTFYKFQQKTPTQTNSTT